MTDQEVQELKARLKYAVDHDFQVAVPELYAERLLAMGAELPEGIAEVDASVLLGMIESLGAPKKAKKGRPVPVSKTEPVKVEAPKPEVKVEAKSEAKVDVKPEVKVEAPKPEAKKTER